MKKIPRKLTKAEEQVIKEWKEIKANRSDEGLDKALKEFGAKSLLDAVFKKEGA